MSALTEALTGAMNTLLRSGAEIPAADLRAFEAQVIAAVATLEARARGNTIHYTQGTPPNSLGLEGDLGVDEVAGDFFRFTDGAFHFLFNGVGKAGIFAPVLANQYGTHPAFTTQRDLDVWLLQHGGTGVVTPVVTAPGVVRSLAAQPGALQAVLTWDAPANAGGAPISSYTVKYRPAGATTYSVFGTTANLTATVTGLTGGTPYEFTVLATNSAGTGSAATAVTATPTGASQLIELLLDGDSISYGYGTTDHTTKAPFAQLQPLLPTGRYGGFYNMAVSGQRSDQMAANAGARVAALLDFNTFGRAKLFVLIGPNDIAQGYGIAHLQQYVTAYVAAVANPRLDVILVTLIASKWSQSNTSTLTDAQIQAQINDHNAWIRTNAVSIGAAGFVDMARDVRLQNPLDTTYYLDGIHPNDAGSLVMAQVYNNYLTTGAQPTGNILVNPPPTGTVVTEDIVWIDLVQTITDVNKPNTLIAQAGSTGYDVSTGHSSKKATASLNNNPRSYFLTIDLASLDYVTGWTDNASAALSYADFTYAINALAGRIRVYGNATDTPTGGAWQAVAQGDVVEIRVGADRVTWLLNGVAFHEYVVSPYSGALQIDTAFGSNGIGARIVNARIAADNLTLA